MDTLRILNDASDPINIRPTATTSPCMAHTKPTGQFLDEDDLRTRKSTGSFSTREEAHWHRHTFAALPSDLVELARRATQEMHDAASQSMPPRSAPPSTRTGTHVQHLRVYGRSVDANGNELVQEHEQSGEAFVEVLNPDSATVWSRGKAAGIEWKVLDDSVGSVHIELLELGSSATTVIAKDAPNKGGFLYTKVPWGMAIGDKYLLRISSSADPSRYMTTCFFAIDSTP